MKIKPLSKDQTINLCLDTIGKKKQAIVFCNSKRSAEKTAEDCSKKTGMNSAELMNLSERILKDLSRPTRQCERLAACVKHGVAFHHAGLTTKQKDMIETAFKKRLIKIIAATPTLAAGLDLPAFRTILKQLRRFTRTGLQYIPVLEYLQMAGRAGRPKYDKYGESIAIASTEAEKEKLIELYINGEPENIYSKLAVEPVLRTYLLSLIAIGFVRTKTQILDFFEKTFWAHQYRDMAALQMLIEKMLNLLIEYEFIISSKDEFASADEIEDERFKVTPIGKRVAELYLDPLTAHNFIVALQRSTSKKADEFSVLSMVAYTQEIRPHLKVRTKEYEEFQEKIAQDEDSLIIHPPSMFDLEYDMFMDSMKTAYFLLDWLDEFDEEYLLETYSIRPGEIKAKIDIADWLIYSAIEISKLLAFRDTTRILQKTRTRLKYGVKEDLLPLVRLRNIGRVRARKLYKNNIRTVGDIKKADIMTLVQILGRKTAIDIKRQVGIKVDEQKVSKRKRIGQMSIEKY
jgi:helicase